MLDKDADSQVDFDEFVNDDGLQGQLEGGLSLEIRYETTEDNLCWMHAEITTA